MKMRGPSVKTPMLRPGSVDDHAADLERLGADENLVADLEVELREQFRPDERATIAQQLVRVRDAVAERHRALQRELLLHGVQFHHLQPRPADRPQHRLDLDRL